MAQRDEISALFPIFVLSLLALLATPWTVYRGIAWFNSGKEQSRYCNCSLCRRAPKNQTSVAVRVGCHDIKPIRLALCVSRSVISHVRYRMTARVIRDRGRYANVDLLSQVDSCRMAGTSHHLTAGSWFMSTAAM